jgi:CopG family transcriptional regulator/antitoxin EndoAI
MQKRLNVTLPEETIALLDQVAGKKGRSTVVDVAIKVYAQQVRQKTLREKLKEGAIARSQRDLKLAEEWFDLDDEAWRTNDDKAKTLEKINRAIEINLG